MKRVNLRDLTLDELVERFVEIGVAQDQALFDDAHAKFNRLYDQMQAVDDELRSRGRDARLSLLRLYKHHNMQVRLKAAVRTLGVAPEEARRMLKWIYESKWYPQAMDAGMMLRGLDDGSYKPD
jgi:hypothetical protein